MISFSIGCGVRERLHGAPGVVIGRDGDDAVVRWDDGTTSFVSIRTLMVAMVPIGAAPGGGFLWRLERVQSAALTAADRAKIDQAGVVYPVPYDPWR